jgi:hypothetical protein
MYSPKKKLRSLNPYFHIHVSMSDLYILPIGPPIFGHRNINVGTGNKATQFNFWEYLFSNCLQCRTLVEQNGRWLDWQWAIDWE